MQAFGFLQLSVNWPTLPPLIAMSVQAYLLWQLFVMAPTVPPFPANLQENGPVHEFTTMGIDASWHAPSSSGLPMSVAQLSCQSSAHTLPVKPLQSLSSTQQ